MKKARLCLLILVCILLLAGCKQQIMYRVELGGIPFSVDLTNRTIHDGTYTYTFSPLGFDPGDASYFITGTVTFTYPNGATYQQHHKRYGSFCLPTETIVSEDYDADLYTPGDVLYKCLQEALRKDDDRIKIDIGKLLVSIVLIAGGLFGVIFPEQAWAIGNFTRRWKYQDADPTDAALGIQKIGCIICIIAGAITLLTAFY